MATAVAAIGVPTGLLLLMATHFAYARGIERSFSFICWPIVAYGKRCGCVVFWFPFCRHGLLAKQDCRLTRASSLYGYEQSHNRSCYDWERPLLGCCPFFRSLRLSTRSPTK